MPHYEVEVREPPPRSPSFWTHVSPEGEWLEVGHRFNLSDGRTLRVTVVEDRPPPPPFDTRIISVPE